MRNTLNRKYLLQAIDGSLERFGLDFVDLVYCHRPDPETPIEETVWAMSDIITAGKALYWGTSEWSAEQIREAWDVADRHHLHKPVVEQPQYNLLWRDRVEQEYAPLYDGIGLGLTTWSPLGSGLLSGKYLDGVPDGSRATLPGYEWLAGMLTDPEANEKVRALQGVAQELELHPGPAVHRLVRQEPPRLDGHHRCQSSGAGPREPGRTGGHAPPHRRGARPHRRRHPLTPGSRSAGPSGPLPPRRRIRRTAAPPMPGGRAGPVEVGHAEDPVVHRVGQIELKRADGTSTSTASSTASRNWDRPDEVVTSNQASTRSSTAVAVAGNWTLGSKRKAM